MKNLKKILFICLLIFALVFAVAYVAVVTQGKAIIAAQLENALHRKVTINYAGLTPPFNLEIRGLDIAGLAKADYIFISPSIPGLLGGNIVLNELKLVKPEIIYEKTPDKPDTIAAPAAVNTAAVAATAQPKSASEKKRNLRLIVKHLNVKDGTLDFIDRTLPEGGIKITVKNISLNLSNLYIYPRSAITSFELTGTVPWLEGKEEGRIEAKGRVNLFKRDMEASLKVSDIDGIYLYPYYSSWVDLEKAHIQKAKLSVTSDIKGVDGNLSAPCHLELNDILFVKPQLGEGNEKTQEIVSAVMDIFSGLTRSNNIVFNFTIKSKIPVLIK